MDRGKVDVIQPDIGRAGGLTESMRIAKLADDRGLLCTPHGWKSGLTIAAEIHLSARQRMSASSSSWFPNCGLR